MSVLTHIDDAAAADLRDVETDFGPILSFRNHVFEEEMSLLKGARFIWTADDICPDQVPLNQLAVISKGMLARNTVCKPTVSQARRHVLRPTDYGRAAIVNIDCADPPEAWDFNNHRLIDIKGVGVLPDRRASRARHASGVLRLDEAVLEVLVSEYLHRVAQRHDLGFAPNRPLAVLDAGFKTRSLAELRGKPMTTATLLARPLCKRPKQDLPFIEDTDHVAELLQVELSLIGVGLTTMSYMSYALERVTPDAIITRVMGKPRLRRRDEVPNFAFLEKLLDGRKRRLFRYPNVQTGRARDTDAVMLIDLGGIDLAIEDDMQWLLRAHHCEFQIATLNQDVLRNALAASSPARAALTAVTREMAEQHRTDLRRLGCRFAPNWGGELELISAGIAYGYDTTGGSIGAVIEATAERMALAVGPHLS
ncbi:hypothetical protein [uncultured Roseobacter sp.]|uniref:hypothetical protein n=1 Tax=uncultured Roseobacter sp. TaxID=114847 RepID=UPI002602DB53|nr:hypothetical protein [uncultured Roseobacter sp.]